MAKPLPKGWSIDRESPAPKPELIVPGLVATVFSRRGANDMSPHYRDGLMNRMYRSQIAWGAALLIILTGGCSETGKKAKKIRTVDGIARKIDLKNNIVSMMVVDQKGQEREMQGSVREDSDIIVNGRASRLEDVREGDKVAVSYYREGKDDDIRFIATRVEVKRAKDNDWTSTGTGSRTTQPVAGPATKP
jgi:hypothetical protein